MISEEEQFVANQLIDFLQDLSISDVYDIETEESLEMAGSESHSSEESQILVNESVSDTEYGTYSFEYMKKVVDYARPGVSFTTIQHAFPRVKERKQLQRFRDDVERNGNRFHKLQRIETFTLNRFKYARQECVPVHDLDIRRWALAQAKNEGLDHFTASGYWLLNFKQRNGISSRKITKFVSKRANIDKVQINEYAEKFTMDLKKLIPKYTLNSVLNADQISFNYELISKRTLSFSGERNTNVLVRSLNAISHSYTVMPMITAAGELLSPVLICLQEASGRLPERKSTFSPNNVALTCSHSGKLKSSLINYWIREVLDKVTSNRFLLLVDQWSSQTDIEKYEENLTKGQLCKLMVIPGKTTATNQPCDTYFFRQWKEVAKRCYYRVSIDQLKIDLRNRDSVIKLQSLVHNQLVSPLFRPMISFAPSKCDYIPQQYSNFSNVIELCFSFDGHNCSVKQCQESPFINCSHCRQLLFFEHFFLAYHFHQM